MSEQKYSLIESQVRRHRARDGDALITISSSSPGVASYMVATDSETEIVTVKDEHGALAVHWHDPRFGDVVSRISAGAVVEVALHESEQQRDTYREQCSAVDDENRELMMDSMREFVVKLMQELGIEAVAENEK